MLASACGGILYFLGYLGWNVWPCLLVFLVPLWWALEREGMRAVVAGGVFGVTAFAGGFLWLWPLVDVFLGGSRLLGAVLWLAYAVWFAAGFALYAVVLRAMRRRGLPLAVAGVAPLVAMEWLQPQLFPVNAGSALVAAPPTWIQTADLGGPLLLTALVALANVAAFATVTWIGGARSRPVGVWVVTLAVGVAVVVYGRVRIAQMDAAVAAAPSLRVGLVQANLGLLEKRMQGVVTHEQHLAQTRELLTGGPLDLVVWPETAYVRGLRGPLPISGKPILADLNVPLLFGGSGVHDDDGVRRTSNSAFLIGTDGAIRDAYDKNLLIPIAEYLPLAGLVPAIAALFPHAQSFGVATGTPPLRLGAWRIATPICYEVVRADFVRAMVRAARPHLLVTIANDAWFGTSQEPWIHLALARLRAVEHRRFLVRATNSGISAIVDPAGRIVERTGLLTRETLRATVRRLEGETVYGRLGDWVGWVACLLVVGAFTPFGRRA